MYCLANRPGRVAEYYLHSLAETEGEMDWSPLSFTGLWVAGLLVAMLIMTGCVPLPDDEAAWVLEDLAVREGDSRLKEYTPDPVRQSVAYSVQGRTYQGDLYQSAQRSLATLVLVPGVAERGKDDPRLVAFATTLARARFLVLVPDLPNLRALRVQAEDAQGVIDAFVHLLSRPESPVRGGAGIGAFSYAVGPVVLAALDPVIREQVDFVLGVGGYYDLNQVLTFFTTGYFQKEGQWHYLEPNRYGKWVFVYGNAGRLADPLDRAMFRRMAERKLQNPHADTDDLMDQLTPEGRSLLNLLDNRDPERTPALIARLPASIRAELDALNLSRRDLSRLGARLILLHGTDDAIIPYTQSVTLAAAAPVGQSELFLIDGLAHVNVRPFGLDRRALWRAIGALLAQRRNPGQEGQ
jgi:pimeloyl-ACP methyl ester carboxylesterase